MNDQQLPYRIVRLQSKTKPSDRFIFSQTHVTSLRNRPVTLLCFIEIANPWHSAREGAQIISNQLVREFNRSSSQSLIARFENCLKVINETVIGLREKVDGPIDIFIGAAFGQEIHFSTIGSPKIFLANHQGLTDIAVEADGKTSRTFAAVTSGDLSENDILICGSTAISEVITRLDSYNWVEFDEQRLHNDLASLAEPSKYASMSALLLKLNPNPPHQKTYFWEENEQLLPRLLPKIRLGKLHPNLKTPHLQVNFSKITPIFAKVGQAVMNGLRRVFRLPTRKVESGVPARRIWPILVTLIFIIALAVGITLLRDRVNISLNSDTPPKTIVDDISQTTNANILATLKEQFTLARYQGLSDTQKSDLAQLLLSRGVTYLGLPPVIVEYPNPIIKTAVVNSTIFSLDETGQLWRWDGKTNQKIDQANLIAQPYDMIALDEQRVVVSDKVGNVWLFADQPTKPTSLALPTKLASGQKSLASFGKNLYVLNPDGSVYKVTNFVDKFDSAVIALKAGLVPFTDTASWKIDGDYYFLSNTGRLVNITKNKLGTLDLTLTPLLTSPHLAVSNEQILLSSGAAVWGYQIAGNPQKIYYLGSDQAIGDINFLPNGEAIVTLGNVLYQVKFN